MLFTIGVFGIFVNRKNVIVILMSIELILLAVNINLVAFSSFLGDLVGQVFAMFVLTVAAAEAAVGLAILVVYFRNRGNIAVEDLNLMKVFAPLLGAIICGLFNRFIGEKVAMFVATALLFVAAACAGTIFIGHWQHSLHLPAEPIRIATWIDVGDLKSTWSIRLDAISAVMMIVVTGVSSLVHLYSWGYMAEDPHKPRFFAYLSLFTFAMLMLVTANNLVQMFFGWEGVGLASYLLIGFWFKKPSANAAAIKAFVVNRVGDLGFMLGIFGTFLVFGTVSIPEILAAAPNM
eukprot:gene44251-55010_t